MTWQLLWVTALFSFFLFHIFDSDIFLETGILQVPSIQQVYNRIEAAIVWVQWICMSSIKTLASFQLCTMDDSRPVGMSISFMCTCIKFVICRTSQFYNMQRTWQPLWWGCNIWCLYGRYRSHPLCKLKAPYYVPGYAHFQHATHFFSHAVISASTHSVLTRWQWKCHFDKTDCLCIAPNIELSWMVHFISFLFI